MDLYCPKCGEPCDNDEFHAVAEETGRTYSIIVHKFQDQGCEGIGQKCSKPSTQVDSTFGLTRQDAASALYDILGDDMDGAAAMLEDMGY